MYLSLYPFLRNFSEIRFVPISYYTTKHLALTLESFIDEHIVHYKLKISILTF